MATLIPEPFPYLNTIEMNRPGRKVEYEVFKSLGNLFDEKSYVIYGPQHIRINKNKQLRDGEFIDFIIIHPEKGMIFLECKGGAVQYKPRERTWEHFKQNSWKSMRPGPLEDAKFGKNNLIRFLKKELNLYEHNSWVDQIPTIHGAIFPNTPKQEGELPPDIKPEMIIWADDYINLETSINKMFDLNVHKNTEQENIDKIVDKLFGNLKTNPFNKILESGEIQQDLEFDRQQKNIYINAIIGSKRFIGKGLAGTGKTILAAKIALNNIYNDKKVLLLTKTNGLTKFLYVQLKKSDPDNDLKNIQIYNIDSFVSRISQRLGVTINRPNRGATSKQLSEYFDNYIPQMCRTIFDSKPDQKYDLVIVDEGQDFHKSWFSSLESIIKDDGQFLIFFDPLQNTLEKQTDSMAEILKDPNKIGYFSFPLTANYRNSSSISYLISNLIKKYFPEELNYSQHASESFKGKKPELIEIENYDDLVLKTIEKVQILMKRDQIKPKDIGIIGIENMMPSKNSGKLSITKKLTELGLTVLKAEGYSDAYELGGENSITFENYRRFKGLEKRAIILVNIFDINGETVGKIYTGLSRARGDLTVIAYPKAINQIKELL